MKKVSLYVLLLFSLVVRPDTTAQLDTAWTNLMTATNAVAVIGQSVSTLSDSIDSLQSTVTTTQATLSDLQDQIAEENAQTQKIENQQALLAEQSDVMKRGVINNIINETDIDFVVYLPDGTTISVGSQSTILMNQLFSSYVVGTLVCGVITIVPQVAGADISSADAQSQATGTKYYLQFNLQGLNQPGYSYGALDYLSVTRADVGDLGNTRAQSLSLDDLVAENDLWAIDITLNYVPTRGDGVTYIYPRFSTLYMNEFDEDDTTTVPDASAQTAWGTTLVIDESTSDVDMSYPDFTGDTEKYWGDVVAASPSSDVAEG